MADCFDSGGVVKSVGTITWLPAGDQQQAYEELNMLAHSMMADRSHRQACGGQGECGTCRVQVVSGGENLTPPTVHEREFMAEFPDALAADERLGCQCRPLGNVTFKIPRGVRDVRYSNRSE